MTKYCYLLLLGMSLAHTVRPNSNILTQALAEHQVDYSNAAQLSKQDLGGLFLAQDAQDGRRIQIKSLNQSEAGDDGDLRGASCGYHALRNGALSGLALIHKDQAPSILKQIASHNHANELFGTKPSPWRIEIGRVRNESTARKVFREMVFNGLKLAGEGANKEFDCLMRCTGEITIPALARPAIWEDGFHYSATKNEVYAALTERFNKLGTQGTSKQKSMSKALNNRAVLDKYFKDDLSIDFTIDFEGACTRTGSSKKVLARVPGDKYGNWIQTDEIPALVDAQKEHGILENEPTLLVATYGEDLGGVEQHAFASEKFTHLYALMRDTKHDCVGVVLVYLSSNSSFGGSKSLVRKMFSWFGTWFSSKNNGFAKDAEEVQSVQNNGHWITLVVSRIKGDMRYYVLDSLHNANRLRNDRINEVIDILDGKKSLPGYSWTARQVEKQSSGKTKINFGKISSVAKPQLKADVKKGYTWSQIGLGTLATGLFAYAAYHTYNNQQKKRNP